MPVYTKRWAEFARRLRFSTKILQIYLPDDLHFFPNKDIIDLICGGLPKRADAAAVNLKGCYLCQFGKQ